MAGAGDGELNALALTADIMAGQHAEAERIHIGNIRQVEEVDGRLLGAGDAFEQVAHGLWGQDGIHAVRGEWAREAKDSALGFAVGAVDGQARALPNLRFNGWHGSSLRDGWGLMHCPMTKAILVAKFGLGVRREKLGLTYSYMGM